MSTSGSRHRGEQTSEQRKGEQEIVLWAIFLVGAGVYLVLLSTVWDRGATARGILLCEIIGMWIERRRGRRGRNRR